MPTQFQNNYFHLLVVITMACFPIPPTTIVRIVHRVVVQTGPVLERIDNVDDCLGANPAHATAREHHNNYYSQVYHRVYSPMITKAATKRKYKEQKEHEESCSPVHVAS